MYRRLTLLKVHHIDPTGADSGVVYSEMQGIENTSANLMDIKYVIKLGSDLPPLTRLSKEKALDLSRK